MHAHKLTADLSVQAVEENRRIEARFSTDERAKMRVLRPLGPPGSEVRVLDISRGGLKLLVQEILQPGMLVQVRLKNAIALAEVRYCVPAHSGYYAGVKLQDVFWTRNTPA